MSYELVFGKITLPGRKGREMILQFGSALVIGGDGSESPEAISDERLVLDGVKVIESEDPDFDEYVHLTPMVEVADDWEICIHFYHSYPNDTDISLFIVLEGDYYPKEYLQKDAYIGAQLVCNPDLLSNAFSHILERRCRSLSISRDMVGLDVVDILLTLENNAEYRATIPLAELSDFIEAAPHLPN